MLIYMSINQILILIIPYPHQYLELSLFHILVIQIHVEWNYIVILTVISLLARI